MSLFLHTNSQAKEDQWIREVVDFARGKGQTDYLANVLVPVAIFILFRWAEQNDIATDSDSKSQPNKELLPEQYWWSSWSTLTPSRLPQFLIKELWPALRTLGGTNESEVLKKIAENFDPSSIDPEFLISAFSRIVARPFKTVGDKARLAKDFEELIDIVISFTRYAGEIATPRQVVDLVVELAEPQPDDQIYDPCFGFGGLLASVGRRMSENAQILQPGETSFNKNHTLYGIEIQPLIFLIGMTRVILSCIDVPILERGDALARDDNQEVLLNKFDRIVAVPPVGRNVFHGKGRRAQTSVDSIENLFLQHIMESLKPGGRAVVVVPETLLYRSGADLRLRKKLLREFCVEGVLSLPQGVFRPYHNLKTSVISFRKTDTSTSIWLQTAEVKSKRLVKGPLTFDPAAEARAFRSRHISTHGWLTNLDEIKGRDYELVAKKSGTEELTDFLKQLQQQAPGTRIVKLSDVAEVFPGVNYDRDEALERLTNLSDKITPLVRVGDIQRGEIKSPTLFLTGKSLERVGDNLRLRAGDILVTASGTVGKTATVRDAMIGAVPSRSLVVVRPKDTSQHSFILSLLRSEPYREWLMGHAMGVSIQHLSHSVLLSLPLPLPPPDIQDQIAVTLVPNVDASAFISAFVMKREVDQLTSFLLTNEAINDLLSGSFDEADVVGRFSALSNSLRTWREKGVADPEDNKELFEWLVGIAEISDSVSDAFELPKGAERLSMIENLILMLEKYEAVSPGSESATQRRMEALTQAIGRALEKGREEILNEVQFSARVEPAVIASGKETEADIIIKNEGALPFRKFQVETDPYPSHAFFKIFHTGKEVSWSVAISSRSEGVYHLNVRWRALRFDGSESQGDISLSFEVRSPDLELTNKHLGGSPYVVATPIDSLERPEMFFGREDILNRVRRALRPEGPATVLLLEGNRRAGKSSILKRLLLPTELPEGWIPAYCSFQGAMGNRSVAGLDAKEIFFKVAREILLAVPQSGCTVNIQGMGDVTPAMSLTEFKTGLVTKFKPQFENENSFEMLELHIDRALEAVKPNRILLMLDEFDKIQEGIETGATSPQVPENIRYLFHSYNGLSGILTGARRIKSLRQNHWSALYGIGLSINVSALDLKSARRLVTQPVAGSLIYASSAADRLITLCARQPYLIQALCHRVFEKCMDAGERSVTVSTVDAAATEMVEDNENFRTLWDYIETDRQRYITCLVNNLQDGPDRLTRDFLSTRLEEEGIYYDNPVRLGDDLEVLRELEVLRLERHPLNSSYNLEVPLFSLWLDKNIDPSIYQQRAKNI